MKLAGVLFCLPLAAVLVLGCPAGGEPSVNVKVDNYCSEVADVACHNMFHCCTGQQIEDILGITISTEQNECRRDVELLCEDGMATVMWAMEKGSVVLLESDATACLQSMVVAGDDCFMHVSEIPWVRWCAEPHWRGALQPGSDCLYTFECVESSYCAADRKCKALPKNGQDCDAFVCAADLFCNISTGRCEPLKSSGQRCESDGWCATDLYCEYNEEGMGTCMGLKSLGVACTGSYQCQSSFCIPGLCPSGEECYEDSDCSGSCSESGDYCYSDYDCPGICNGSLDVCYTDYDCPGSAVCVREQCLQQCSGQSECAEAWDVIDYCEDTLEVMFEGS